MKHAGPDALDRLEPLLRELRSRPGLKEKSRGAFYRKGRAFLHFHEDGNSIFADVRLRQDFQRFRATTAEEHRSLLRRIEAVFDHDKLSC